MNTRRNDPDLYRDRRDAWWRDDDPFSRSLREVNRLRLVVLRRLLAQLPRHARVVDIGCGGGLVAVPLHRAGWRVVGVDIERAGLRAAAARGVGVIAAAGRRLPRAAASADLVCLGDVVEHVPAWPTLLAEATRIARPGARLVVSTIRSGPLARALAVWLGEGLGLVPRGTHDAGLFVAPQTLCRVARHHGWRLEALVGTAPEPLPTIRTRRLRLRFTPRISAEYLTWFRREDRAAGAGGIAVGAGGQARRRCLV